LEHRCYDCPIHDAVLVLNLRPSNALVGDRYAVLHRDHYDGHLCVNELDRRDAAHRFEDVLDDHQNCVRDSDGHHLHVDDLDANRDLQSDHQMMDDHDRLDGRHHDAGATDDLGDLRNDHVLLDDHHHDADAKDDRNRNCVDDLDGRRRGVDGKVVNRHDEGLWLQRHLGELDGLNHYLVLGDADRFCLV
jgi:hypothetical protein